MHSEHAELIAQLRRSNRRYELALVRLFERVLSQQELIRRQANLIESYADAIRVALESSPQPGSSPTGAPPATEDE